MSATIIRLADRRPVHAGLDWEQIARINVRRALRLQRIDPDRLHQAEERAARLVRTGCMHDIAVHRAVAWARCAGPTPPRVA